MRASRSRVFVLTLSILALAGVASAEPSSKYVRKALVAMGGEKAIDAVDSIEMQGTLVRNLGEGQQITVPTHSYLVFPDRYRQESTLENGMMIVTILTPSVAVLRVQESDIPLPEEQRNEILRNMHRNPLKLLQRRKEIGSEVKGTTEVDGRKAVLVSLGLEADSTTLAIDAVEGDLLQMRFATDAGKPGEKEEMAITYSDYREVGKLRYPFVTTGTIGDREVFSSRLESVVVNGPVAEALWEVNPEAPDQPMQAPADAAKQPAEAPAKPPAGSALAAAPPKP